MRTSLACLGLGVGFHALFNKVEPSWLPRVIASVFLVLAVAVIVLAERRACTVISQLESYTVKTAKNIIFACLPPQ